MKKILLTIIILFFMFSLQAVKHMRFGVGIGQTTTELSDIDKRSFSNIAFTFIAEEVKDTSKQKFVVKSQVEASIRKKFLDMTYYQANIIGRCFVFGRNFPATLDLGAYLSYRPEDNYVVYSSTGQELEILKFDIGAVGGLSVEYKNFFLSYRFEYGLRNLVNNMNTKMIGSGLSFGIKFDVKMKEDWE